MNPRSFLLSIVLCAVAPAGQAAHYGEPFPAGEPVSIDVAAARVSDYAGKPMLFAGRITEVCQAKGCWVVIEHDGQAARVKVAEDAFTLPKDATGRATVYGVLSEKVLDEAMAKHLAEDAGRSQPVARRELRIAATAVAIAD